MTHTGTDASASIACWNCGADLADVPRPISRHAFCRACGEALHACRQCRLFDGRGRGCHEPRAEAPTDPTSANFCEWFEPITVASGGGAAAAGHQTAASRARAELEALFKAPAQD